MTIQFGAVHESASGPSRHSGAARQSGRFRREADILWLATRAGRVANDRDPIRWLSRNEDEGLRHSERSPGPRVACYGLFEQMDLNRRPENVRMQIDAALA